jgi:putative nucleotidyltransferase with HDIG domain
LTGTVVKPAFSFLSGIVARRIFALFLLCALLPIGSLAAFSLWEMSGTLKGQTDQRLHRAAKNINVALLQGLGFLQSEMEVLANSSDDREEKSSVHFLGLTLFREGYDPHTIFGTPCPLPFLTDPLRAHMGKGLAAIFTKGVPGALSRVYMAVSIKRGSFRQGILVGEIDPKYLGEIIESAMPLEGDLTVLDSTGAPLYNLNSLPPDVVRHVTDELRHTHAGWFEWNREGGAVLAAYRSIFMGSFFYTDNWTLVFLASKAWMFAPIRSFIRTFVLIVILTVLLVSLLSIVQIRRSLAPLEKLQEGTRRIGRGNFESRIEVKSGDEFEELSDSFNSMTERLGREFRSLTETSRIVRSVLTGLEKGKIVNTILSKLTSVIPCATVALSLLDPGGEGTARTYAGGPGTGNSVDSRQHPAVFTPEELRELEMTDDSLIVEEGRKFQGLLPPLSENGAIRFVLLPLQNKEGLVGVLAMGYRLGSNEAREDLIRARQIADQVAVALRNAGLVEELAALNLGALTALARAVDAKSSWTAGHSERVTTLSMNIGRAMGLPEEELDLLHRGGLLHDLGKIGVPGAILDKKGKLTDQEFAVIKSHPEKGVSILEPIPAFRAILSIVAQHHEWVNGRGYPRGLAGDEICRGARIVAVADVYEALTTDRPYRPGWHPHRALSYLEEKAGVQFDPEVVKAFKNIILAADGVERFPQEVQISCPGV